MYDMFDGRYVMVWDDDYSIIDWHNTLEEAQAAFDDWVTINDTTPDKCHIYYFERVWSIIDEGQGEIE